MLIRPISIVNTSIYQSQLKNNSKINFGESCDEDYPSGRPSYYNRQRSDLAGMCDDGDMDDETYFEQKRKIDEEEAHEKRLQEQIRSSGNRGRNFGEV